MVATQPTEKKTRKGLLSSFKTSEHRKSPIILSSKGNEDSKKLLRRWSLGFLTHPQKPPRINHTATVTRCQVAASGKASPDRTSSIGT